METRRQVCAGLTDDLRMSRDVIELTGRQLRHLQGSYVYWMMYRDRHCYIGMKSGNLPRPFERSHHVIKDHEIHDDDAILIFPMPSGRAARWTETAFIEFFRPDLNRSRPLLGQPPAGYEDDVRAFLPPPPTEESVDYPW